MTRPRKKGIASELIYQEINPDIDLQLTTAIRRSDYAAIYTIVRRQLMLLSTEVGDSQTQTLKKPTNSSLDLSGRSDN